MPIIFSGKDNTKQWRGEFEKAVERALTRIGLEAEGNAKDRITANKSVDTGLLRNSITYAVSGRKANISSYRATKSDKNGVYRVGEYNGTMPEESKKSVYIGTNVEYGAYVELGSRGKNGKPFLKPAATDFADDYRAIMKDEMQNA